MKIASIDPKIVRELKVAKLENIKIGNIYYLPWMQCFGKICGKRNVRITNRLEPKNSELCDFDVKLTLNANMENIGNLTSTRVGNSIYNRNRNIWSNMLPHEIDISHIKEIKFGNPVITSYNYYFTKICSAYLSEGEEAMLKIHKRFLTANRNNPKRLKNIQMLYENVFKKYINE